MPAPELLKTKSKAGPPKAGLLLAGGILLATLLVQSVAGAAETLQWQRHGGSLLSWLTGHLCHWSWNHLAWDLFAFGLLSFLAWRLAPSRYAPTLLLATLLIPLEIGLNQPLFDSYRGLSGLDCALFGLVVAALWQPPTGDRSGMASKSLAVLGACGFLAKTFHELSSGHTLFVEMGTGPAFVPALSAHLVGFGCGLGAGLWPSGSRLIASHSLSSRQPARFTTTASGLWISIQSENAPYSSATVDWLEAINSEITGAAETAVPRRTATGLPPTPRFQAPMRRQGIPPYLKEEKGPLNEGMRKPSGIKSGTDGPGYCKSDV